MDNVSFLDSIVAMKFEVNKKHFNNFSSAEHVIEFVPTHTSGFFMALPIFFILDSFRALYILRP